MNGAVILSIWCGQAGETDQCVRAPAAQFGNLTGTHMVERENQFLQVVF